MGIISNDLIKRNLDFAIENMKVTLTRVDPPGAETYAANKQDVTAAFEVFDDGREATIDTRFYLAIADYAALPVKGWILTDGEKNYKVMTTDKDAPGVTLRLDCASEFQR